MSTPRTGATSISSRWRPGVGYLLFGLGTTLGVWLAWRSWKTPSELYWSHAVYAFNSL